MFWLLAIGLTTVAVSVTIWPLLRNNSDMKVTGMLLLLLIPVTVLLLYRGIGSPTSQDYEIPVEENFSDLTGNLRDRLEESPEHLEGWVLLGRSYKSMQQFPQAVEALETAARIDPDSPLVMVELVEARLFASGNPRLDSAMVSDLKTAVGLDPQLQKGLWLLGIAAVQAGDDAAAVGYWRQLLAVVEPDSAVAASVNEQMTMAHQRLRLSAPAQVQAQAQAQVQVQAQVQAETQNAQPPWPGLSISLNYSGQPPAGSALFVIARQPGVNRGPPLAVRRISSPVFPLATSLDDSHAMLPGTKLSQQEQVEITARLALQGQPQAMPGDWQSHAVTVSPNQSDPLDLHLASKVR